jgi:nucleoside-diphosphate-sugar epimerase
MDLARELIAFAPRVSLRDGLRRTIDWYAASGLVRGIR